MSIRKGFAAGTVLAMGLMCGAGCDGGGDLNPGGTAPKASGIVKPPGLDAVSQNMQSGNSIPRPGPGEAPAIR